MEEPVATDQGGTFCLIPLAPSGVVGVPEFQQALLAAKNKGQMLRVCFRTLGSMGYGANELWSAPKLKEFLEDYK